MNKEVYPQPKLDTKEMEIYIAKATLLGWKWIDPRGGFAYQWQDPSGIYTLEGPFLEK